MSKRASSALAVGALLGVTAILLGDDGAPEIRADAQLRAMSDELARAKTLHLNDLDKPYFIQYAIGDTEQVVIAASLGGITYSSHSHFRVPQLQVRVGDYKFDNSNSVFSASPRFGLLPIDDDYQALRTELWLSTDALYKASTDQITRKRNALREIADPDQTPDLAPAKPVQILQAPSALKIDQKRWEDVIRRVSERFAAHPNITESNVRLQAISSTYRMLNSEGAVARIPQELSSIAIRAGALASDGSHIWNRRFIEELSLSQFPDAAKLDSIADAVASETEALIKAPIAEDYSGPALFEPEAAAQMMAIVLSDAVRLHRKPLAPAGANDAPQMLESVWSARLGSKVAPDWLTIYDDPHEKQFKGVTLAGQYDVDDEGIPAQRVLLVDKGTLRGFLASREPVRQFNTSNGHGRLPGGFGTEEAVIGNLFVQADQTIPANQMTAQLLEKVKAAGLKYGILIRRLNFPFAGDLDELQSLARQLQKNGYARTVNPPLVAYRVYPDGREELVRGVRFKEFSAKELRDIAAASDQPYVLNYINNGSGFDFADMGSDETISSVICPGLLFDNIDLARAEEEPDKLPIVPPPSLIAQQP